MPSGGVSSARARRPPVVSSQLSPHSFLRSRLRFDFNAGGHVLALRRSILLQEFHDFVMASRSRERAWRMPLRLEIG
jgi:hypothetical protein